MVLKVAVLSPVPNLFDYLPPPGGGKLRPGLRLEVPFGSSRRVGILWSVTPESALPRQRLKAAFRPLDPGPLFSESDLKLLEWLAGYYHAPIGEVVAGALPPKLRQPDPLPPLDADSPELRFVQGPKLNRDQERALQAIVQGFGRFAPFLLEGVTGSGKTEVYLEAIRRVVEAGKQALVLLPEIALTPKIEERFRHRFGPIVSVYHSGLTPKKRLLTWLRFQRGELPILIGTRSATLIPMKNPGLIVVDEEHDPAYKQQEGVRFSARDVAIRRAQLLGVPIVLGSATPSLETLFNGSRRYHHLLLPKRAGGAGLPKLCRVDMRGRPLQGGFLPETLRRIGERLERGEQVIVFHNRRGYAPVLACQVCDWVATCRHCSVRLVYHKGRHRLCCHHCGGERPPPEACPSCGGELLPLGRGTERIEKFLESHFPGIRLGRLDRDTARSRRRLLELLSRMERGEIDLLVGTQMLSKGHHFPGVTLVVIPNADAGLLSCDFRAPERLAQLVVQVAGRAGRGERPGEVILQTRYPDHPFFQALLKGGYRAFAQLALREREMAGLPPFSHQALLVAEAKREEVARDFLTEARRYLQSHPPPRVGHRSTVGDPGGGVLILGPAPAPIQRRAGLYRYQLLLQAERRPPLHRAIAALLEWRNRRAAPASLRLTLDVDPTDLL